MPNAATERWCKTSPAGPPLTAAIQHLSSPLHRIMPIGGPSPAGLQRLSIPLYTPAAARDIRRIAPAEEIVRELATGCSNA